MVLEALSLSLLIPYLFLLGQILLFGVLEKVSLTPNPSSAIPKIFHHIPKDFGYPQGWRFLGISSMSYLCPFLPGVTSAPWVTFPSLCGKKKGKGDEFSGILSQNPIRVLEDFLEGADPREERSRRDLVKDSLVSCSPSGREGLGT